MLLSWVSSPEVIPAGCSTAFQPSTYSALFGLWHIAPTLHTMTDNREFAGAAASTAGKILLVLGAIAVTFVAGLVFCWLRLRSKSLLAPVLAHAATDGLALTVAWFAVH